MTNDRCEVAKRKNIGIKAMQSCRISQPVKSLAKHNFTAIY